MPQRRSSTAGGVLLALGAVGGTVLGYTQGQPSAGLLLGVAAGAALAVAIWLRDRRR